MSNGTLTLIGMCILGFSMQSQAAIIVTTSQSAAGSPPTVSSTDLGQTAALSYAGTNGGGFGATVGNAGEVEQLFNGVVGNTDGAHSDPGETTVLPGSTVTVNFDVSSNALGYDILDIFTVAGWNTIAGGRSNQGYAIDLTYVDDSAATLVSATAWEPNSPAEFWTTVSLTNSGGGALFSDTVDLNSGGAVGGNSVLASGVKSMKFYSFSAAGATGFVTYREFDILGTPTVPEPATMGLLAMGGLALRRRRH